jgi:hypothetical protein
MVQTKNVYDFSLAIYRHLKLTCDVIESILRAFIHVNITSSTLFTQYYECNIQYTELSLRDIFNDYNFLFNLML